MTRAEPSERFLVAKELSQQLQEMGVRPCSYDFALALIKASPDAIKRSIRLSDALAFMREHREFKPFRRWESGRPGVAGPAAAVITCPAR